MIQQNSIEAFEKVLPKINERQFQILNLLSDNKPRTNAMIGKELTLPINCITNRVLELRKKELLKEEKTDNCLITGNKSSYWKIKDLGIEVNNFRSRKE